MGIQRLISLPGWALLFLLYHLLSPAPLLGQTVSFGPVPSAETQKGTLLWNQDDSWIFGAALLGTAGLALWDEDLREVFQKNRSSGLDTAADGLNLLGHPLTDLAIGGAIYAAGQFRGDEHLTETGLLAAEAVIGAEVLVLALKAGVGRQRPGPEDNSSSFRPFSFDTGRDSFPSGHTAGAFALASVLSQRSESPWTPWAAYGFAGMVGVARLVSDDHWASDVLAGAAIGELMGRLSVRWGAQKPWRVYLAPEGQGGVDLWVGGEW